MTRGRWALAFVACAVVVGVSFACLDAPIARAFWRGSRMLEPLGHAFGALILVSGEATVLLALAITRLMRGRLPGPAATLALACVTSIAAYAINDLILKALFGVPTPSELMHGVAHAFHPGSGSARSSFPSGHMVLASAFAGVLMRRHEASVRPLAALLLLGAALLIAGDWHFLSDVVAGGFIGLWVGWLAGGARWPARAAADG